MEKAGPAPKTLPGIVMPWVLAGALFIVYLATLNPSLSLRSANVTAYLGGWADSTPVFEPLLSLTAMPLRLLPPSAMPAAFNAFAALCAALAAGAAARCVALLPYDRSRGARMRGHDLNPWLHVPLAWAPPVLAAGLVGLPLTAWENATAQTGESLSLLVFALAAMCLCEYRVRLRDGWLWLFAFLLGAGAANNWAMIGFIAPFTVALIWIRGVSIINPPFLVRMLGWFAAGLLLYLVGAALAAGSGLGFLAFLKGHIGTQRALLLSLPRGKILLLAIISIVPLAFVGVRWGRESGSSFEQMLTTGALGLIELAWLAANVVMAFDPKFSPRRLVYLDPASGGLPLLTFSFCGAVASSYVVGRFILLGSVKPSAAWARQVARISLSARAGLAAALLVCLATPAALAVRNWPLVAAENKPWLPRIGADIADALPAQKPAIVVCDDPIAPVALYNELLQRPEAPRHLVLNQYKIRSLEYRRRIVAERGTPWPGLKAFADATVGVADRFIDVWGEAAANGAAFYVNPSINFLLRDVQLAPVRSIFQARPFSEHEVKAPPPTADEVSRLVAYWQSVAPAAAEAGAASMAGSASAGWAAEYWSHAATSDGLGLQLAGRVDEAAKLFAIALSAQSNNLPARVNMMVNAALRAGKPVPPEAIAATAQLTIAQIVQGPGLPDVPDVWMTLGLEALNSKPPLLRAAAAFYLRAKELDPAKTTAWLGYIAACNSAREYGLALEGITSLRARGELGAESSLALLRHELVARLGRGELQEGERSLLAARNASPQSAAITELLAEWYAAEKKTDLALQAVDEWQRIDPKNPKAWVSRGEIFMSTKDYDNAAKAIVVARTKAPQDADLARMLMDAYFKGGKLDLALKAADEWQRLSPVDDTQPVLYHGIILMQRRAYKEAIPLFDGILERKPDDESARANRAISLLQTDKLEQARRDYLLLEQRSPNSFIYQYGLGDIARRQNDKTEAVRHFERYLKLAPRDRPELEEEIKGVETALKQLKGV